MPKSSWILRCVSKRSTSLKSSVSLDGPRPEDILFGVLWQIFPSGALGNIFRPALESFLQDATQHRKDTADEI